MAKRPPVPVLVACLGTGVVGIFSQKFVGDHGTARKKRIIVIGGGVVGSATAYSLARRGGVDVTLIDAGEPFGSSWGESRLARLSQDTPLRLELMRRAKELWDQLSQDAGGRTLLKEAGMLDIGDAAALRDVLDTYKAGGVPHELLTPAQVRERWPAFRLAAPEQGLYQADGWVVLAKECVDALYEQAERHGALVIRNDAVRRINVGAGIVRTEDGLALSYDAAILCCGPWTNKVLRSASLTLIPVVASCEQQTYFAPKPGREAEHGWDRMPIFIDRGSEAIVYGVPHIPGGCEGVKVACHQAGPMMVSEEHPIPTQDEGCVERVQTACEGAFWKGRRGRCSELLPGEDPAMSKAAAQWTKRHLPGLKAGAPAFTYRCPYTSTEDGQWVVGPHPGSMLRGREDRQSASIGGPCAGIEEEKPVFIAAAFSGEGFKFAPAVGEAVADMALGLPERVAGLAERASPARFFNPGPRGSQELRTPAEATAGGA